MPVWMAEIVNGPAHEFAFWMAGAALICAVTAFFGFRNLARARLMADMPTSRIASASQGYAEFEGTAALLPGPPVVSPLTLARCTWWDYRVEQKVRRTVGGRTQTEWKTISRATSDELFLLIDPSGECIVDPHGARVIPSLRRRWQGPNPRPRGVPTGSLFWTFGDYRYTERLIQVGDPLYAIGLFRTQHGVQSYNEQEAVRDLLAEWKRDQAALLARFDANEDGTIDLQEWEAVRRAALEEVRQTHVDQAVKPDINVLARPGRGDRRPYILSTRPQEVLARHKRLRALAYLTVAVLSFAFAATALEARFG